MKHGFEFNTWRTSRTTFSFSLFLMSFFTFQGNLYPNATAIVQTLNDMVVPMGRFAPATLSSPTTIDTPGYYCLTNDIRGPIVIQISEESTLSEIFVVIDLNGYTIETVDQDAITVISNPDDEQNVSCLIYNGTINASYSVNPDDANECAPAGDDIVIVNGIKITQSQHCHIHNINFIGNGFGMFFEGSKCNIVHHCTFLNQLIGIVLTHHIQSGVESELNIVYSNKFIVPPPCPSIEITPYAVLNGDGTSCNSFYNNFACGSENVTNDLFFGVSNTQGFTSSEDAPNMTYFMNVECPCTNSGGEPL